jgi:hypothetical protein
MSSHANTHDKWMEDHTDHRESKEYIAKYIELRSAMKQWIDNVTIVTYGAIGRRYLSEYSADMIDAAIRELSSMGIISYDENKPAPQMIKLNEKVATKKQSVTLTFNGQRRDKFAEMIGERSRKSKATKAGKAIAEALAV